MSELTLKYLRPLLVLHDNLDYAYSPLQNNLRSALRINSIASVVQFDHSHHRFARGVERVDLANKPFFIDYLASG